MQVSSPRPRIGGGAPALRLGFVPSEEALVLVAAREAGWFDGPELSVALRREVGLASLRDRLVARELDAALVPAPLVWDLALGLTGATAPVIATWGLTAPRVAVTLSTTLRATGADEAGKFRAEAARRRGEARFTFAIPHLFSAHHLRLRRWLAAVGVEPGRQASLVVVPLPQVEACLAAGTIDGFCAGEPWSRRAVGAGIGWQPAWSPARPAAEVTWALVVRRNFPNERPDLHLALLAALRAAAAWCEAAENRPRLAAWLTDPRQLGLAAPPGADPGGEIAGPGWQPAADLVAGARFIQAGLLAAGLLPAALARDALPAELFSVGSDDQPRRVRRAAGAR